MIHAQFHEQSHAQLHEAESLSEDLPVLLQLMDYADKKTTAATATADTLPCTLLLPCSVLASCAGGPLRRCPKHRWCRCCLQQQGRRHWGWQQGRLETLGQKSAGEPGPGGRRMWDTAAEHRQQQQQHGSGAEQSVRHPANLRHCSLIR